MRHPTEGILRRLIDEPAGVSGPDRDHVTGCPRCLGQLATMRADADLVGAALATEEVADVDVAAGWRRLSAAAPGRGRAAAPPRSGRARALLRRPAVAGLAVAVVLAGAGTAAANDWLQIFRTEQIAPVSLTAADVLALPDLSGYGEVAVAKGPDLHEVPDAAAAAEQTGLAVPEVTTLPAGVSGEPDYQVGRQVSGTFTFSAARAARTAAESGEALPAVPPGLDGSRVKLVAGPGVAQVWSQQSAGVPSLLVGRAVAPKAFSTGVPFTTVRDYLLSLPGLPESVAAQLRTFTADGSTLPLPVNSDEISVSSADVNGVPATVLSARDRTLAAAVWVDDGVVTAVAGALTAEEVLSVARGLR